MSTEPTKRPTIAELEAILNDPNPGTISIAPDGSVHVLPHGMARESQAEVDSLRARLAAAEQKASEGEKDGARLDWLDENGEYLKLPQSLYINTTRAAIDDAMLSAEIKSI